MSSAADLPLVAVRAQVASAVQLVACCDRLSDGARKITTIAEVLPLNERGEYRTQDLFVYTPITKREGGEVLGYHAPTGVLPSFLGKLKAAGFGDVDESFFDPATYGLPPPPEFHAGEAYTLRWVKSLKHREEGRPDPASYKEAFAAFEAKLKRQSPQAAPKRAVGPVDEDKTPLPTRAPPPPPGRRP
jgi:pilus assembly protein CpaF